MWHFCSEWEETGKQDTDNCCQVVTGQSGRWLWQTSHQTRPGDVPVTDRVRGRALQVEGIKMKSSLKLGSAQPVRKGAILIWQPVDQVVQDDGELRWSLAAARW